MCYTERSSSLTFSVSVDCVVQWLTAFCIVPSSIQHMLISGEYSEKHSYKPFKVFIFVIIRGVKYWALSDTNPKELGNAVLRQLSGTSARALE